MGKPLPAVPPTALLVSAELVPEDMQVVTPSVGLSYSRCWENWGGGAGCYETSNMSCDIIWSCSYDNKDDNGNKDSKYDDTMVSTTTQQSTLYGIAGRRKTTQQGWQQQQQQCTWQQTAQWTMRRWTTDTKRTAENDKDNRWWRRTMRMTEDNNRQPQQTTTTDINNGPHILFSLCLALDYFAQPPTLVCSSNIIANDGKCCVSHFDTLADMRIGRVGDMSDNMLVTCWWHDTLCCQNRRQANTA